MISFSTKHIITFFDSRSVRTRKDVMIIYTKVQSLNLYIIINNDRIKARRNVTFSWLTKFELLLWLWTWITCKYFFFFFTNWITNKLVVVWVISHDATCYDVLQSFKVFSLIQLNYLRADWNISILVLPKKQEIKQNLVLPSK